VKRMLRRKNPKGGLGLVKRLSAPSLTVLLWAFSLLLFALSDKAQAADLSAALHITPPALFIALAFATAAIIYLLFNQRRQDKALGQLAELSEKLYLGQDLGQELSWQKTGAIEIDLIAATLTRIEDRLKQKRLKLQEVSQQIDEADEHRRTMNLELHHRVNNALAMMQGITNITARSATDISEFRTNLSDRVQCLGAISTLLVKKSWTTTPLRELVEITLACCSPDLAERVDLGGEDLELRSEVTLALGMTLHELLSNAIRHGALANETGRVTLNWRIEKEENGKKRLILLWREQNGPIVEPPSKSGVGQYLMQDVLTRQFGGDIAFLFPPQGFQATITAEI
ncbi:MAG: HWE histidine kinase domain-containing protein, partial [Methylocystis sp.]